MEEENTTDSRLTAEMRESHALHEMLLNTSPDIIYIFDIVEKKNIYANDGIRKILGYSVQETQHMGAQFLATLMHPDDFAVYTKEVLPRYSTVEDGALIEHSYRMKDKDGAWRWLLSKESVFQRLPDGRPQQIFGLASDVTERRQAEEALTHSHDLMRYIIEHSRSAIAVHDRGLRYIYVSQRYLDEYRVKEREVIGKHHYDVFPDLPQKWRDVHQKALAGQVSSAEDDSFEREDGTIDRTRWECRPWYEADGSIGGIIIYTEVITERKRVEEELKKYRDHLEDLVAQRTADIEAKNRELERLNKLFVDREFRIKELRDEVVRLKGKARS